ncbi:hypothetical protein CK203_026721 [Vitis vinifera]|uniref:Myb-like domain-containing protein n=1 Tax=Vitis vinifera TaxID=29760 RepID=A0A438IUC7_VITVI|nr:hypothetical protein CK203_026721 [Vitis vinifera]
MEWQWKTMKRRDGVAEKTLPLLNALKAFPKDVPMRWEKIAAAVPGRSKAACMKRFSELKKGFGTPRLLLRSNCVEEGLSPFIDCRDVKNYGINNYDQFNLGKSVGCMADFELEGFDLLRD